MTYKTKSYFILPVIPNYFKTYGVDSDRKLEIKTIFSGSEIIPLEGLAVKIDKGRGLKFIINSISNSGNLTLTGSAVNGIRILENVYNVKEFKDAIDGNFMPTHANNTESLPEFTENDLSNTVIYYPHIPKIVDTILIYRLKRKYRKEPIYTNLKRTGDLVHKGDVIAKYGPIEVTAASDGKIVFLSQGQPGKLEWPDSSETTVTFSKETKKDDCYCVGIQILNHTPEPSETFIRNFYNHGNVWVNMDKQKGMETVYTLIDHGLCDPDNYLPKELRKSNILKNYWALINQGQAYTESINPTEEKNKYD